MQIISKNRQEGKTTELIKMSAETGYRIIVHSDNLVNVVSEKAKALGLDIPFPISKRQQNLHQFRGETFLIDELELFVESNIKVHAATINKENLVEDVKDNPVIRMEKSLDKLTTQYDNLISIGKFNDSLNVLKNIEMLSRQIKDVGYEKLHTIYKIIDNGVEKQLITLWEQNCFGNMRNVQTWVVSEKYTDTYQNWMQGLAKNWNNLGDDVKSSTVNGLMQTV